MAPLVSQSVDGRLFSWPLLSPVTNALIKDPFDSQIIQFRLSSQDSLLQGALLVEGNFSCPVWVWGKSSCQEAIIQTRIAMLV